MYTHVSLQGNRRFRERRRNGERETDRFWLCGLNLWRNLGTLVMNCANGLRRHWWRLGPGRQCGGLLEDVWTISRFIYFRGFFVSVSSPLSLLGAAERQWDEGDTDCFMGLYTNDSHDIYRFRHLEKILVALAKSLILTLIKLNCIFGKSGTIMLLKRISNG